MSAEASRVARDWLIVVACLVCQTGMGVGRYILPAFLQPVTDDLGWSHVSYVFALTVTSSTVALIGPLVGWMVDRRGPRPVPATRIDDDSIRFGSGIGWLATSRSRCRSGSSRRRSWSPGSP